MKLNKQFQIPSLPKDAHTDHQTRLSNPKNPAGSQMHSTASARPRGLHPSTSRSASGSKTHQTPKRGVYFRPAPFLIGAAILAFVSMTSSIFTISRQTTTSAPYEIGTAYAHPIQTYELLPLELHDGNLLATISVTKPEDWEETYYTDLTMTASSPVDDQTEFLSIPSMGFDCSQVYVTSVFPQFQTLDGLEDVTVTYEPNESQQDLLHDYEYLLNEPEMATHDTLLKAYRQSYPEHYNTIALLSDGSLEQSGVVSFQVTPGSSESAYLDGDVNIVYKKDGQVVFGGLYNYSSSATQSKIFAYTPPVAIPEYDSVEIIDLH